ncbi:hypothetical protein TrLO_g1787 [Triparma laevis f. longispina]|uniref:Uncharacterized protein n=1 Tax=Triparma laevis f. longispina TaxID=1714387 RepID=A0A9W7L0E2_9STRA|nr:hypothetical protein TrLO_g1787 [Triparma laevis f. longispina]
MNFLTLESLPKMSSSISSSTSFAKAMSHASSCGREDHLATDFQAVLAYLSTEHPPDIDKRESYDNPWSGISREEAWDLSLLRVRVGRVESLRRQELEGRGEAHDRRDGSPGGLFKLCVSPAQKRKDKWPAVRDELLSASFEELLAFVMRAFMENCGSDVDEAGVRDLEKSEMERSLEEQKEA